MGKSSRGKREQAQISSIRDEKGNKTTDIAEIKMIRKYN